MSEETCRQIPVIKMLVVGNSGVGKTSIVRRLAFNRIDLEYKATIGADFAFTSLVVNRQKIHIHMYDIAGQEMSNVLVRAYYRGAHCAMVVGDVSEPHLEAQLAKWKRSVEDSGVNVPGTYPSLYTGIPIPCFALLNKCDKEKVEEKTTNVELENQQQRICDAMRFKSCFRVSALTGENLKAAIEAAAAELLRIMKESEQGGTDAGTVGLKRTGSGRSGCC